METGGIEYELPSTKFLTYPHLDLSVSNNIITDDIPHWSRLHYTGAKHL